MNSFPIFFLKLFGHPSIEREDGVALTGPAAQRHRMALLALLALAPERGVSREKLMTYLWPERDIGRSRQLLNQAVYQMRKALGEASLFSGGDDLGLNLEAIRADVVEFERALERGDHEAAVELHRGPFLDGFFLSDAPDFERWADRERERLAGAYAKALEALAEAAEEQGNSGRAVEWWKTRAAQDPYDSRVALRLMQALEASGNRAGALQHAAIHQRLLEEEFEAEPDPAVLALAKQLRREPAARARPGSDPVLPPLALSSASQATTGPNVDGPLTPPPGATPQPLPPSVRPGVRYGIAAMALGVILVLASQIRTRPPESTADVTPEPSIAVLPFANHSTDPGDGALADGITEELIAMLWKRGGLRVIGSTSVSGFRDHQLDVRSIADSLQVGNILEGAIQKVGSRLRVRVRLIDGQDGSTRWSDTYDRELEDVFAVQDDIAQAVARELGVRLGGTTGEVVRQPTQNVAAYELYVRGNDRSLLRSDSAAREGLEYFRQAIALDSTYAAAWAGLGRMYLRVANAEPVAGRERYHTLGEEAARKAVSLDDSLAEAHATLGVIRLASFDFEAAERHLTRAIELDPSRAHTHEWMVTLQLREGRPEEALVHAERALVLDPLSPTAHAEMARALLGNDRCDEALALLEKLTAVQPPLLRIAGIAAHCYARKNMWREAIETIRPRAERGDSRGRTQLGYLLARAGQTKEALGIYDAEVGRWERGDGNALDLALLAAGLGDFDQAFVWLDRSVEDHSWFGRPGSIVHLILMEELSRDPRFDRLRQRLGLQNP